MPGLDFYGGFKPGLDQALVRAFMAASNEEKNALAGYKVGAEVDKSMADTEKARADAAKVKQEVANAAADRAAWPSKLYDTVVAASGLHPDVMATMRYQQQNPGAHVPEGASPSGRVIPAITPAQKQVYRAYAPAFAAGPETKITDLMSAFTHGIANAAQGGAMDAYLAGDPTKASAMNILASPGKGLELFKPVGETGYNFNPATGQTGGGGNPLSNAFGDLSSAKVAAEKALAAERNAQAGKAGVDAAVSGAVKIDTPDGPALATLTRDKKTGKITPSVVPLGGPGFKHHDQPGLFNMPEGMMQGLVKPPSGATSNANGVGQKQTSFANEAEVRKAVAAGTVKKGDRITVGGKLAVWE